VLAGGGYFTWRNLRVTQQGQFADRFAKAVEQLGSQLADGGANIEMRLGAIYALEQISRDSGTAYYWPVIEVVTAYVRRHRDIPHRRPPPPEPVPTPPSLRDDVQAIMTVLARRKPPKNWTEPASLDLTGAYLVDADLRDANLARAKLVGARLDRAKLANAELGDATLTNACLRGADLRTARGLATDQVASAESQGIGAQLPAHWRADWRARFSPPTESPAARPALSDRADVSAPSNQDMERSSYS
jgi:hypothetical protein